ncbi:MAG: hypothetical protein WBV73_09760 [Phormidium sp.]
MKYYLGICIAILACVMSACGPAPEGTRSPAPEGSRIPEEEPVNASAPQGTVLRDDDQFEKALNQATSATNLAKSAKTEAEWKAVGNQWNKAIELMKSVPKNDPNYQLSQQKIGEYQKSLGKVKKKLKI